MQSPAFKEYNKAYKALRLARTICPDSWWYMTNESGSWIVKEGSIT